MGSEAPAYAAAPYDYGEARAVARDLELPEPVAIALVRRGHRTPAAAREFLEGEESHPAELFGGIERAVAKIDRAVADGQPITVHGDYDVDGICATAILVRALRSLGADCGWIVPDRFADGYGLSDGTLERAIGRGGLLITADCGITSVEQVATARAAGLSVVVTDHHEPGERLPDCPIVHPRVCGYPFGELCGAAVAHKLVEAVERERGVDLPGARDLDLLALATIADMVPLVGENRALARRGLAELRRAPRPGLRALIAAASIEPERLDEGDIAFRLAPRINAAGRLYRADAGVELLLTPDPDRAAEIASELDAANRERRDAERELLAAAEAALRALPGELREAPALLLAGEGWHPGLLGIVASRIVERQGRPAVLIGLDRTGRGRGSGRSVAGFDLLGCLERCAQHLVSFGGHRAAAGLEVERGRLEELRSAFVAAAWELAPDGIAAERERVDAVVGADGLGIEVAEQLERLGPFGIGNPPVRLLVPWARAGGIQPMGAEDRHARFNLLAGGRSARAVAFGVNGELAAASRAPHDLTVALELNHWNGSVSPRAVLRGSYAVGEGGTGSGGQATCECGTVEPGAAPQGWWERFERELAREWKAGSPIGAESPTRRGGGREPIDARGGSVIARLGELVSSGARVLAVCADAGRRSKLATVAADPARFGGVHEIACRRCPNGALGRALTVIEGHPAPSLLLTDWETLAREPEVVGAFEQVVAVDPPCFPEHRELIGVGEGYLHLAWGPEEAALAERLLELDWAPRSALAEIYRAAARGPLGGPALEQALLGAGSYPRTPEVAARCVRVLVELGIAGWDADLHVRELRVVSSERTALERSEAWTAYAAIHQEAHRFLRTLTAER